MVVGTGNRLRRCWGYTPSGVIWLCAYPLGDLYKTQVRRLAAWLGVPAPIIGKPPTADLWPGQTDEGELGFTYEMADQILTRLVDDGMSEEEVVADGFDADVVREVAERMAASAFKRCLPPTRCAMSAGLMRDRRGDERRPHVVAPHRQSRGPLRARGAVLGEVELRWPRTAAGAHAAQR